MSAEACRDDSLRSVMGKKKKKRRGGTTGRAVAKPSWLELTKQGSRRDRGSVPSLSHPIGCALHGTVRHGTA